MAEIEGSLSKKRFQSMHINTFEEWQLFEGVLLWFMELISNGLKWVLHKSNFYPYFLQIQI